MRRAFLTTLVALGAAAPALAADTRTYRADAPLRKLRAVRLEADLGAGNVEVNPDAPGGKLYTAKVEHDPDSEPEARLAGGKLTLSSGHRGRIRRGTRQDWEVRLSRVPTWDMEFNIGATRAFLDLSGIPVRSLELAAGAAQVEIAWEKRSPIPLEELEVKGGAAKITLLGLGHARVQGLSLEGGAGAFTLDFAGASSGRTRLAVRTGVGSVEVRVPRGVGLRVVAKDVALAHVSWPDDLDGDESTNYAKAKSKIDLSLTAAVGSVKVSRF